MTRFVVVGDVMLDVSARVSDALHYASDTAATISLQPGGAALNTARWLAASGHPTVIIGAVGADAGAEIIRQSLDDVGVEDRLVRIPTSRTGVCIVLIDPSGERTMLPDAGANGCLTPESLGDLALTAADHLHLSGYTLLNAGSRAAGMDIVRTAHDAGCTVSLDPASVAPMRATPGAIEAALPYVDILIANADEACALTGVDNPHEALELLAADRGAVVKLGPEGAIAARGTERARVPAAAGSVLDTTGAGDAFTAGFLPPWRAGAALTTALTAGCRMAADAISRVGAGPPAPLA